MNTDFLFIRLIRVNTCPGGHASPYSEAAPGSPPTFQWNVGYGQWECQGAVHYSPRSEAEWGCSRHTKDALSNFYIRAIRVQVSRQYAPQ